MNRRHFSAGLIALGSGMHPLLAWGQAALSAQFVALRTWVAPDSLRLTMEYTGALGVNSFLTDDTAPKLVIELQGLAWNAQVQSQLNQTLAKNPLVERVRSGLQANSSMVRCVLDLKQAALANVSTVAAVGAYQQRLLIDVYPANTDLIGKWLERQQGVQTVQPALPAPSSAVSSAAPATSKPTAIATKPAVTVIETPPLPHIKTDKPNTSTPTPAPKTEVKPNPKPDPKPELKPDPALAAKQASKPSSKPTAVNTKKIRTIAIDAGHGGEDPGAIGPGGTKEKDVVLAMALQLAQRLRSKLGWKVVLTRDGDYFVSLADRVKKARAANADLMVSIHADAFFTPTARGASVYALSEKGATSAAARWIANKENNADLVGGLNLGKKDKLLTSVMLDMSTTAQINASLKLGKRMVAQLGGVAHMHKKQVEQAGFAVLKAPDIPSLLIETAFISHPEEEQALTDPKHQAKLVAAISKAIATL